MLVTYSISDSTSTQRDYLPSFLPGN